MSYQFARINLDKTNYQIDAIDWQYILQPDDAMLDRLVDIYRTYCIYKHFPSVMPMFRGEFLRSNNDIIGYYDQGQLEAWSMIQRFDDVNALCYQFAWTYHRPRMRLGIRSLEVECAIYKDRGYRYLYLEQAHLYKQEIDGFEILGPMT